MGQLASFARRSNSSGCVTIIFASLCKHISEPDTHTVSCRNTPFAHASDIRLLRGCDRAVLRIPFRVPDSFTFTATSHMGGSHLFTPQYVCSPTQPALTLRKQQSPSLGIATCVQASWLGALAPLGASRRSSSHTSTGKTGLKLCNNKGCCQCLCLALSLPHYISVSRSLSASLRFARSLPHCVSLSKCLTVSCSLTVSRSHNVTRPLSSLPHCVSLAQCLAVSRSLTVSLSLVLTVSHSDSLSQCLTVSPSLSASAPHCVSLSHCLTVSRSHSV